MVVSIRSAEVCSENKKDYYNIFIIIQLLYYIYKVYIILYRFTVTSPQLHE